MIQFKRILLVEDSEKDIELALAALGEHNLANEVIVVRDGAEALDFLFRRGEFADRTPGLPVVVLLDLKMPKVDGLDVLKQVKNDPELKRIPVVMMTSSREEQDLVKSYALGANAYVVKPVDFQQFVDSIKQIGFFWAILNEPPPGCAAKPQTAASKRSVGAPRP
ncbi:MAG TPA: response regulator [Verrucomicrobiae bacterium]|jgi:CheY-like chemotaxis protein|nr:response regulator [Verrucomicrobiae bacterium]